MRMVPAQQLRKVPAAPAAFEGVAWVVSGVMVHNGVAKHPWPLNLGGAVRHARVT
jgi:hypothetical protein